MKLFRFTLGTIDKLAVFADSAEAEEKRADVEPVFWHTPVVIEEVILEGYEIVVNKVGHLQAGSAWEDLDDIRAALKAKGVKFPPNTGEARLRELAAEHL